MKKFLSLVLLIMTTSCTNFNQEEKFVNPLFYQEMRPGAAKEIWNVKITPTSYTSIVPPNTITHQEPCQLVKNTETEVALKCFRKYSENEKEWFRENRPGEFDDKEGIYHTYVFNLYPLTIASDPDNAFYIRKSSYYEDEKHPTSFTGYSIDAPRSQYSNTNKDIPCVDTFCFCFSKKEFSNPLFYNKLSSQTINDNTDVEITPTSYTTTDTLTGDVYKESCELLKNKEKEIVLKCHQTEVPKDKELRLDTKIYQVILSDYITYSESEKAVWIYSYSENNPEPFFGKYMMYIDK